MKNKFHDRGFTYIPFHRCEFKSKTGQLFERRFSDGTIDECQFVPDPVNRKSVITAFETDNRRLTFRNKLSELKSI